MNVDVRRVEIGIAFDAVSDPIARRVLKHEIGGIVIEIYDGGFAGLIALARDGIKEFRFRRPIIFHRTMIIEMILRQIGENGGIELHARYPIFRQRVTRHFHHHHIDAAIEHRHENVLQVDDIGRRVVDRENFFADHNLDRAYQPHLQARVDQHRADHICCGGFAVGAGDADHSHFLRRIIIEVRDDHRQ